MLITTARGRAMKRHAALRSPAIACASIALVTAACAPVRPMAMPNRGGHPRELPGVEAEPRLTTQDLPTYLKTVSGKEPPTTLIAGDGSRCTVTERRYRDVQVGDDALCAWRKTDSPR